MIGPYLIISIALNVAAVQFFKGKRINFSSRNEVISIFTAAMIGLISPLPTYAAIPIGISMMSVGVPFSSIVAFIISSPLMNPSIFFLTATQISMEMAIIRTVAALLIAVIGGFLTIKIFKWIYTTPSSPNQWYEPRGNSPKTNRTLFQRRRWGIIPNFLVRRSGTRRRIEYQQKPKRSIFKEIYRNVLYVGKTFSVSILISAAIKALLSPQFIERLLGGNAKTGTLAAIALGIPFYTCGGAAIPFIETLIEMGMSKGTVLAFFISGPATKLETIYAYNKLLGKKVLFFYLALTLIFSYATGLIYSLL